MSTTRTDRIANLVRRASIAFALSVMLAPDKVDAVESIAFSFGANGNGRTALNTTIGNTPLATPINMTTVAGKTITNITAGGAHSLLLADDGVVFSFGWNFRGQTGLNTTIGDTLVATPIDGSNLTGKTMTQIAAGLFHSLLLASDGTVFSMGDNSSGRTGLNTNSGETLVATPIDATNLAGKTIKQIAAGHTHSLLLASDGTVFSFGFNGNGQTGLNASGGSTLIATPIDATNLAGKTIKQIAAGDSHSLLLADDGTVFSFGLNLDGATGLNTSTGSTLIATPIDATNLSGKAIKQVAAGTSLSLLLAEDGTVFSFGSNLATGLNTMAGNTLIATPIDATNLAGKTVTHLAAGNMHSLLLTDDGTVLSFGNNGDGLTGQNTTNDFTMIATPIDTTNLGNKLVTHISAGTGHSLLLAVPEPSAAYLLLPLLAAGSVIRSKLTRLQPRNSPASLYRD